MSRLGENEGQVEMDRRENEKRQRLENENVEIKSIREKGFAQLKAGGDTVLLTQKQLDNETLEQARMWGESSLLSLLRKGTNYCFTPPPLL